MMKKCGVLLALMLFVCSAMFAQSKKVLTPNQWDEWKRISGAEIANNGNWVIYGIEPYRGDSKLVVYNTETKKETTFDRGSKHKVGFNSNMLVFKIKPQYDSVRIKKLKKVSKKDMPKDTLAIYLLAKDSLITRTKVKSFAIGEKGGNWVAYQLEELIKEAKDTLNTEIADSVKKKEPKKKKEKIKDKEAPKAFPLYITNPLTGEEFVFEKVTEYNWSEDGNTLAFVEQQNDTILKSTLKQFDAKTASIKVVKETQGVIKKVTLDKTGLQLAFIFSADTIKEKVYSLWFANSKGANKIAEVGNKLFPTDWTVSENGRIYFSDKGIRLFYGIAKKPITEPEDTLLDSEKVGLDLWSWTDKRIQPEQLADLEDDLSKTYLTYYDTKKGSTIVLETEDVPYVYLNQKGDGEHATARDNSKYQRSLSWDIQGKRDIYLVKMKTGEKTLVKEKTANSVRLSPKGQYLYWYSVDDSCYYSKNIKSGKEINMTKNIGVNLYDEEYDYPSLPDNYGIAGWTNNDKNLIIYDKYDIWKLDPTGKQKPLNITKGEGRKNNIVYRHQELDHEKDFIDINDKFYLSAFNKQNKQSGYYLGDINGKNSPKELVMEDYSYYTVSKAKNSDNLMWRKMSFTQYPDLWFGDMSLKGEKISDVNPQQKEYNWGTSELYKWTTFDGEEAEGLLIKPENFDPNKKYPVIVYFYRLSSDELHDYSSPKPSRSIINKSFYASNGYIVFVPNIRFKTGHPGHSSYNYIVSGAMSLKNLPYVDYKHMGLQGQSWGGYQVTYLITKTNLFAAAEAGAPVTNMTSAYGGIRWQSGMSRMFQYEQTQSRIGGTLWEKLPNYLENSAVFSAPQIETPLLIMSNDNDGAVPWYQGIELFMAMRRLDKPCWLMNYNGEPHNLKANSPNSRDLSVRMMQFFDHYLKGKPAPVWMIKGIPAVEKGKSFGFELMEE